jgi:hypothetical protein
LCCTLILRKRNIHSTATRLNAAGNIDSAISTSSTCDKYFKNVSVNINAKHPINRLQEIEEGNVDTAAIFGLSATVVASPFGWWSLTAQACTIINNSVDITATSTLLKFIN